MAAPVATGEASCRDWTLRLRVLTTWGRLRLTRRRRVVGHCRSCVGYASRCARRTRGRSLYHARHSRGRCLRYLASRLDLSDGRRVDRRLSVGRACDSTGGCGFISGNGHSDTGLRDVIWATRQDVHSARGNARACVTRPCSGDSLFWVCRRMRFSTISALELRRSRRAFRRDTWRGRSLCWAHPFLGFGGLTRRWRWWRWDRRRHHDRIVLKLRTLGHHSQQLEARVVPKATYETILCGHPSHVVVGHEAGWHVRRGLGHLLVATRSGQPHIGGARKLKQRAPCGGPREARQRLVQQV